MRVFWFCFALSAVLPLAPPASASDLAVTTGPALAGLPGSVSLEPDDAETLELVSSGLPQGKYMGTLAPLRSEWVAHGFVVARWTDKRQPIRLRVTQMSVPKLPVSIFNYDYAPDMSTLNRIDDGLVDLDAYLTRYFVARDVYAKIAFMHEVKVRALRIWYDAAYALAKQKRYFAIDEEVMKKGAAIEQEAKSSPQLASMLQKYNGAQDYFTANNRQFRWLFFSEIALVQRLVASKHYEGAQIINDYFLEQVKLLSDQERQEMFRTHQIAPDTLEKNAEFLKQLVPGSGSELFPK